MAKIVRVRGSERIMRSPAREGDGSRRRVVVVVVVVVVLVVVGVRGGCRGSDVQNRYL